MRFEALTLVNSNNEKVKKEREAKKLKNRIKRLFKKYRRDLKWIKRF